MKLKLTCSNLSCQISQEIKILLLERLITLSRKKSSQTKSFPMKTLDLEITNLLDS